MEINMYTGYYSLCVWMNAHLCAVNPCNVLNYIIEEWPTLLWEFAS
jgi:hypothetical protein